MLDGINECETGGRKKQRWRQHFHYVKNSDTKAHMIMLAIACTIVLSMVFSIVYFKRSDNSTPYMAIKATDAVNVLSSGKKQIETSASTLTIAESIYNSMLSTYTKVNSAVTIPSCNSNMTTGPPSSSLTVRMCNFEETGKQQCRDDFFKKIERSIGFNRHADTPSDKISILESIDSQSYVFIDTRKVASKRGTGAYSKTFDIADVMYISSCFIRTDALGACFNPVIKEEESSAMSKVFYSTASSKRDYILCHNTIRVKCENQEEWSEVIKHEEAFDLCIRNHVMRQ